MRYPVHSLVVLFLFSTLALNGQTDISIRKKEFKTDKPGFKEAWRHVNDGDLYFSERGVFYAMAFDEYLKAIVYNDSNAELNYKTGIAALFSDRKEEAAGFLLKALELKKDVTKDILIVTGRSLQYAGRFSEAIEKFNNYLTSPEKKPKDKVAQVKKYMEECNSALRVMRDTLKISVTNLGPNVNSTADDYTEVLTTDGKTMYFASRRENPNSGKRYADTKFDENILVTHSNNKSWDIATSAGKNLTTKYCETPLFIDQAGIRLYIYAGYENAGDIKVSEIKNGEWQSPKKIPFPINTNRSETSISISPSGNEIYYVTDKAKDGFGGKDIYYIKKINDKKWSKPQNAGGLINTPYDEESVKLSQKGDTLWFSSRGHNSIGGFDIFYSPKNKSGEWDTARNAGYPINTPWDELFYSPAPDDDSSFYFVSNRSGGNGGLDIYQGHVLPPVRVPVVVKPEPPKRDTVIIIKEITKELPPVVKPEPVNEIELYLAGKIRDSESGEPVLARIDVIDRNSNEVVGTTASSDVDGTYKVKLPAKKIYMVDLRATGYLSDMKRIDVPENWPKDIYNLNIDLIKVKVGKKVVLKNILFETGKAILTTSSYAELDRLLVIMEENPQMRIEISGHTDITGTAEINNKLSQDRAKAVVEYLIQKGIVQTRMEFKGYGSQQPVAENTTAQGRAKNRRVEFKILEF